MPGIDLTAIESAVGELLATEAAELVDLRYLQEGGRWVLRCYVDKHGGVTLDDCEYLSGRIGALLDTLDAVPHSYVLEVSSPGLDRVLKKERDFLRFAGHRVRVRLREPRDGQRRFRGRLAGVEAGSVLLEAAPPSPEEPARLLRVELDRIEEARLDPEVTFGCGPKSAGLR